MTHNRGFDHPWIKAACVPSRQQACERAIETPTASLPPSLPFHQVFCDSLAQTENVCATRCNAGVQDDWGQLRPRRTEETDLSRGRRALEMLADDGAGLAETPNTSRVQTLNWPRSMGKRESTENGVCRIFGG